MKYLILLFVTVTCLMTRATAVQAETTTTIMSEDFSHKLHRWEYHEDSGATWQIVDDKLRVQVRPQTLVTILIPKDEYWSHGLDNMRIESDITPIAGGGKNMGLLLISGDTYYAAIIDEKTIHFAQVHEGYVTLIGAVPYEMVNGTTYHASFAIDKSIITFSVNNQILFGYKDSVINVDKAKPGIMAGNGVDRPTIVDFDNIKIVTINPDKLPVPFLSQNDREWGLSEYDSATKWVATGQPTTIDRWGCKLVSELMILRYLGYYFLSDNRELTVKDYNIWLRMNTDFSQGLIVTNSASKFTQEIAKKFTNIPIVEQAIITDSTTGDLRDQAIQHIDQGNPAMLQLSSRNGDHFVVAVGVIDREDKEKKDLIILDPEDLHTKLSGYTKAGYKLASVRVYKKSFTDLSRISMTAKPTTAITITDLSGKVLPSVASVVEAINNPAQPLPIYPAFRVVDWAKPVTQRYILNIVAQESDVVMITLNDSKLTDDMKIPVQANKGKSYYQIDFKRDTSEGSSAVGIYIPSVIPTVTPTPAVGSASASFFTPFSEQLDYSYKQEKVAPIVYAKLKKAVSHAASLSIKEQKNRALKILQVLDKNITLLSPSEYDKLHDAMVRVYTGILSFIWGVPL